MGLWDTMSKALGGYAASDAEKAQKKGKDAGELKKPDPEDKSTWKMETYVDDKGDLKERKVKSGD